jgi:outer membrane scaffolding protein for murein synthesis (MipA/OmpV family)
MIAIARILLIWLFFLEVLAPDGLTQTVPDKNKDGAPATVPLWEIKLFTVAALMPDYRGSDEYRPYVIPFPYLIYRGKHLRVDREGVRGVIGPSERVEFNLAFSGNPPAKNNEARAGMPPLDAIGEAGMAAKWFILPRRPDREVLLQAAVRSAFSAGEHDGLKAAYQGLDGDLRLVCDLRAGPDKIPLKYGFSLGANFAEASYNGYFYDVDEQYARADRPAYASGGGYAGCWLATFFSKQFSDTFSLVAYLRWDNIKGAVYEDSPLVKAENNFLVGLALNARLFKSERPACAVRVGDE